MQGSLGYCEIVQVNLGTVVYTQFRVVQVSIGQSRTVKASLSLCTVVQGTIGSFRVVEGTLANCWSSLQQFLRVVQNTVGQSTIVYDSLRLLLLQKQEQFSVVQACKGIVSGQCRIRCCKVVHGSLGQFGHCKLVHSSHVQSRVLSISVEQHQVLLEEQSIASYYNVMQPNVGHCKVMQFVGQQGVTGCALEDGLAS